MNEFLLLIKGEDHSFFTQEQVRIRLEKYNSWMEEMLAKGKFISGEPLQKEGRHLLDANTVISDGPFLEPKEIIGGYILIRAADIEEAVEIAKSCPLLSEYEIIIRPIHHNLG